MNNINKTYPLNNKVEFEIVSCGHSFVENDLLRSEIEQLRAINVTDKDWSCERFWVIKNGRGHIITTFGEFDVIKGHAYYIPSISIIDAYCEDFMEFLYINFNPITDGPPLKSFYSFNADVENFSLSRSLIKTIIKEHTVQSAISKTIINNAMSTFMSLFIKDIKTFNAPQILSVFNYINEHFTEEISINALSKQLYISPEYFCCRFKKFFNMSPQQFITQKRISHAKHLLLSTDLPVSTIAQQCGYRDPLYFSKIFSKYALCSPSNFRNLK